METEDDANHYINLRHDCVASRGSLATRRVLIGDQPFPHLWRYHLRTTDSFHRRRERPSGTQQLSMRAICRERIPGGLVYLIKHRPD